MVLRFPRTCTQVQLQVQRERPESDPDIFTHVLFEESGTDLRSLDAPLETFRK